jgi:hypothetical protein
VCSSVSALLAKPLGIFDPATVTVENVVVWLQDVTVLNVAGNRESRSPGLEQWTQHFLIRVFRAVKART